MERSKEYYVIGLGQGGGRIAEVFSKRGYRAVAINTASQDLDALPLAAEDKYLIDLDDGGAGKDIKRGRAAFDAYKEDILDFVEARCLAGKTGQYVLCVGAGGGSGTGGLDIMLDLLRKDVNDSDGDTYKGPITLFLTLPLVSEGDHVIANAKTALGMAQAYLADGKVQSMVLIDNNRVKHLLGKVPILTFWSKVNDPIVELWDKFNVLSAQPSAIESLDPTDYLSIVNSAGCLLMGRTSVAAKTRGAVAEAFEVNIDKGMLAEGFDLLQAKAAGTILCGDESALDLDVDALLHLKTSMRKQIGGVLHSGVYVTADPALYVYTLVGGLPIPEGLL